MTIPGNEPVACGVLEDSAASGFVDPAVCPRLPEFTSAVCGCADGIPLQPSVAPTPAPLPVLPTPNPNTINSPGYPACFVCGPGRVVENAGASFGFPGQPDIACGSLEVVALDGFISPEYCVSIQPFVARDCGCVTPIVPTPQPTTPPTVQPVPVPVPPTLPPQAPILPTSSPSK